MTTTGEQVYQDLQRLYGLNPGAAAGVVGNFVTESGVNPTVAPGDGGTSHGLGQWHAGRWTALVNWAKGLGKDPNALDVQEAYAVKEAKDSGLWSRLARITDPAAAAELWAAEWERPASHDYSGRAANARKVAATAGHGIGVPLDGSSSNAPLPTDGGGAGGGAGGGFTAAPAGISLGGIDVRSLLIEGLAVAGGATLIIVGLATVVRKPLMQAAQTAGSLV